MKSHFLPRINRFTSASTISQSISSKHLVFDSVLGRCHPQIQIDDDLGFDLSLGRTNSIELTNWSLGSIIREAQVIQETRHFPNMIERHPTLFLLKSFSIAFKILENISSATQVDQVASTAFKRRTFHLTILVYLYTQVLHQ